MLRSSAPHVIKSAPFQALGISRVASWTVADRRRDPLVAALVAPGVVRLARLNLPRGEVEDLGCHHAAFLSRYLSSFVRSAQLEPNSTSHRIGTRSTMAG